ncbi:uncharacterized protein BKA78DRAFT_93973 [Phyllosticta capitalensis]|uniref:uncharacterized protein n=1 Tax=Phyllosticta capitalensis TaxID=121624 RepID=UPI00312DBF32
MVISSLGVAAMTTEPMRQAHTNEMEIATQVTSRLPDAPFAWWRHLQLPTGHDSVPHRLQNHRHLSCLSCRSICFLFATPLLSSDNNVHFIFPLALLSIHSILLASLRGYRLLATSPWFVPFASFLHHHFVGRGRVVGWTLFATRRQHNRLFVARLASIWPCVAFVRSVALSVGTVSDVCRSIEFPAIRGVSCGGGSTTESQRVVTR